MSVFCHLWCDIEALESPTGELLPCWPHTRSHYDHHHHTFTIIVTFTIITHLPSSHIHNHHYIIIHSPSSHIHHRHITFAIITHSPLSHIHQRHIIFAIIITLTIYTVTRCQIKSMKHAKSQIAYILSFLSTERIWWYSNEIVRA